MQIKEVVIDKTELFNKRRANRANVRPIKPGVTLSIEKQRKVEKLMNEKIKEIELLPYKLFSAQQILLLKPITKNFFQEISPIEILQLVLQDHGEQLFTPEQFKIADEFVTKYKDKILIIVMHQLNNMDKLSQFADEQEWFGPWRKYILRFDAMKTHLKNQLSFFQNA